MPSSSIPFVGESSWPRRSGKNKSNSFDNVDIDYADTFVEQMKAHGYWD